MGNRIFKMLAVACLGLPLATPPAIADIIPLKTLNRVGNSPLTSQLIDNQTVLQLTPNYDTNPGSDLSPAGAAWTKTPYDVADGFSVNFHFKMTDPTGNLDYGPDGKGPAHGGDGIAFLIQNSSAGDTALGLGAGGMGFMYIPDSVAIMLDTYQNATKDYYGDPSNNYISVNTRGTEFNVPHHFCTNGILTADASIGSDLPSNLDSCKKSPTLGMTGSGGFQPLSSTTQNMDDGKKHDLGITYVPGTMDIYLDSVLVLAVSLDLGTTLSLQGGKDAFLGFTAGTRNAYQYQDILDFTITPEPAAGQLWIPFAMIVGAALSRKWRRSRS